VYPPSGAVFLSSNIFKYNKIFCKVEVEVYIFLGTVEVLSSSLGCRPIVAWRVPQAKSPAGACMHSILYS